MKAMKKAMEAKKEDKKMKAMKKEKPMRAMKKTMKAKEKAKKNNHSGTRRSGTTRSMTKVYRQLPRTTDTLVLDRITDNVGLEEVSSLKLLKEKNGCRVWVRIWNTV